MITNTSSSVRKRIAIFIPTFAGGGAESAMVILAQELSRRGFLVDLILKKAQGELLVKVPPEVNIINFDVPAMRHTITKLVRYINQKQPDTIISALELPNVVSILARILAKSKPQIIISIHGIISKQNPIYHKSLDRVIFKLLYPRADHIVAVSNICAQDAVKYLHLPHSKINVNYNPVIDEGFYIRSKELNLFSFPEKQNYKKILSIGRLEKVKDHQTLLLAFKEIQKKYYTKLIILGEGTYRKEISKWVNEMGLENDVIMPGFVQNPLPIMRESDVLVNASKHESFSIVIVEALACHCPVVSTACGGPEEILANGKYGHLVPIGDHIAMAETIEKVFKGDLRLADTEWLNQFSVESNTQKYVQLIS